jgi:hypothetical protein
MFGHVRRAPPGKTGFADSIGISQNGNPIFHESGLGGGIELLGLGSIIFRFRALVFSLKMGLFGEFH